MSIRLYKSYTPGTRNRALSSFSEITTDKPERSLVKKNHRNKGRNNRGVITIRHRGGGHPTSVWWTIIPALSCHLAHL